MRWERSRHALQRCRCRALRRILTLLMFHVVSKHCNLFSQKSDNLQYDTLGHWVYRPNNSSTKHLMFQVTMEGLCTKHLSFSLLAKNLKKRSFEARSGKHSCYILGNFYPVLHPPAWQFWHHTVRN